MSSKNQLLPEAEELQIKHIASLACVPGARVKDIAKEVGLSEKQVRARMATDLYRNVMQDIGNTAVSAAKQAVKAGVAEMVPELLANLKNNLTKGNINAVYPTLKVLGFDVAEDVTKDTNLTVIIGGEQPKQVVNVTPQKEEG